MSSRWDHQLYLSCNTYLIFILVLVLEAIGLGFTVTHLEAFKFSLCINSQDTVCTSPSFFYCSHSNSCYSHFPHSWHSSSSFSQLGSNLSILHIHLPIPHIHLHRTTVLQLNISPYISYSSSSLALLADFPSMRAAYHALVCTRCREIFSYLGGEWGFLMWFVKICN